MNGWVIFVFIIVLAATAFYAMNCKTEMDSYKRQLEHADQDKEFWHKLSDKFQKEYFTLLKEVDKKKKLAKKKLKTVKKNKT